MQSSYRAEDVTLLLKDITGQVQPLETKEREKRIFSVYKAELFYYNLDNALLVSFGKKDF